MLDPAIIARTARRNAGLTQQQLADRLGVTQPAVARLERAGANPRVSTLAEIASATGCSLNLELDIPSGIDESMISADLALTPDERLRRFESFYGFASSVGGIAFPSG